MGIADEYLEHLLIQAMFDVVPILIASLTFVISFPFFKVLLEQLLPFLLHAKRPYFKWWISVFHYTFRCHFLLCFHSEVRVF
jgi:hypothetical protein